VKTFGSGSGAPTGPVCTAGLFAWLPTTGLEFQIAAVVVGTPCWGVETCGWEPVPPCTVPCWPADLVVISAGPETCVCALTTDGGCVWLLVGLVVGSAWGVGATCCYHLSLCMQTLVTYL
jgi:hypothetical protein